MKGVLLTIALVFFASPVFAQELDLGGLLGADAGSLLNIPAPRGAAPARGATAPRGAAPNAPPVDRLVRLRSVLTQANAPLAPEQETALNGLITAEIPAMRRTLAARVQEIMKAKGPAPDSAPAPVGAPAAAGQRGAPPNLPTSEELAPDIIRLNDGLLGKIAESPALKPEQQVVIKKLYKDQIRARGGFEAIQLTMNDAGAPFTPEQIAQIRPLFDEQIKTKAQLTKETQGQPDEARLKQVERETLAKVLKLLTPAQRAALMAPPKGGW